MDKSPNNEERKRDLIKLKKLVQENPEEAKRIDIEKWQCAGILNEDDSLDDLIRIKEKDINKN